MGIRLRRKSDYVKVGKYVAKEWMGKSKLLQKILSGGAVFGFLAAIPSLLKIGSKSNSEKNQTQILNSDVDYNNKKYEPMQKSTNENNSILPILIVIVIIILGFLYCFYAKTSKQDNQKHKKKKKKRKNLIKSQNALSIETSKSNSSSNE
ncbi:hypothetical protein BLOT_013146 [Blomia tropicalis]|nr:hypothetical protein BLOT_013146 [Blomia tropicalis]